MFNNASISCLDAHKYLGVIFDKGLTFENHLKEKICKANKGIGLIATSHPDICLTRFTSTY